MIVKEADDRRRDIRALENLLALDPGDMERQYRIGDQLRNLAAGAKQERDAAHLMQLHYGNSRDWAVIHDLRIEHAGDVAQIDHLLINRLLEFWICESKSVAQGIAVDAYGDFTRFYNGRQQGMASPIEQNVRHMKVMQRLLDADGIRLPTRLGFTIRPALKCLVLISSNARLTRPKTPVPGLECLIKTDQLHATIARAIDSVPVFQLAKLVDKSTLFDVATQVAALHRPKDYNWARRFPVRQGATPAAAAPMSRPSTPFAPAPSDIEPQHLGRTPRLPPICAACAVVVSAGVRAYCRANAERFGDAVLCRECQPAPGEALAFAMRERASVAR